MERACHLTGKVIAMLDTEPTPPTAAESFLVPLEVAELYEERFVPALFADWAPAVADVADLAPGQRVLDVACGTGILARTAADRVGELGIVTGVDANPAMLTVAGRVRPDLDWRLGDAQTLPFGDGSFDRVMCQMALMFFR
jgi:SAM-dependent methyltransferase